MNLVTLEWPPYIGSNLKNNGFLAEIIQEAFQRTGYVVTIEFLPWNRALFLTKRGDYHGLIATYHTEEREEYFHYHQEPLGTSEIIFLEKTGQNIEYESMEDLRGYLIGVNRGFAYPTFFEEADYLMKVFTDSTVSLLQLLLSQRVDLIVEDKSVLFYLLQEALQEEEGSVNVLQPFLEKKDLYLAFSVYRTEGTTVVLDFNNGLLEMKRDGTFEEIMERHGM